MDDLAFGSRNKRGDWTPNEPAATAPLFIFPLKPLALLKWIPSYFLPFNLLFAASAYVWWAYLLPDFFRFQNFDLFLAIQLYFLNTCALMIFYGLFEIRLYVLRAQGQRFKFNGRWPSDNKSDVFWFKSQLIDNVLRTLLIAMPLWTFIQYLILSFYAHQGPSLTALIDHPIYFAALALIVPVIHETHFYLIHRALHWRPLYRLFHSVHHNSVNPSPFSSLSMHPVEVFLYLGVAFWHVIIPSHPLLALYQLHYAGFGAIPGHIGFDKIELGEESALDTHSYIHYLHHKYFEVNYGDGLIPFDKWFGTWHDGTKEADDRMNDRMAKGRNSAA
jgi:sterol desaturase/sphingolipid hydroxylase (fatty acid hydroxylase superfamily)